MKEYLFGMIEKLFADKCFLKEIQIQLAMGIELYKDKKIEAVLEKNIQLANKNSANVDIWFEHENTRYAIELKYKTKDTGDGTFINQGAQNNGKYDFVNDIHRVEQIVKQGFADKGFAILITNDPKYWNVSRKNSAVSEFDLISGETLEGTYTPRWKDRTEPIVLEKKHEVQWREIDKPFLALIIEV